MYVPEATRARKVARSPSTARISNSLISTCTGVSGTSLCLRASLYAGIPWIFLAENGGGIFSMMSCKLAGRRRQFFSVYFYHFGFVVLSPFASYVSVGEPKADHAFC